MYHKPAHKQPRRTITPIEWVTQGTIDLDRAFTALLYTRAKKLYQAQEVAKKKQSQYS